MIMFLKNKSNYVIFTLLLLIAGTGLGGIAIIDHRSYAQEEPAGCDPANQSCPPTETPSAAPTENCDPANQSCPPTETPSAAPLKM